MKKVFWNNSISFKLLGGLLFLSVIPLLVFTYVSYKNDSQNLKNQAINELISSSVLQQKYIENWLNFRNSDILSWAQSDSTVNFLSQLTDTFKSDKKELKNFINTETYSNIVNKYESNFIVLLQNYDYILNVFLIDKNGNILYTLANSEELGTNILSGKYASSKHAISFKETIRDGEPHFSDVEPHIFFDDEKSSALMAPLYDKNNNIIGVISVQLKLDNIFSLFALKEGHNNYLVGQDGLLCTKNHDKKNINSKIHLEPLIHQDKDNYIHNYINHFNKSVFAIYKRISFDGIEWILVNEVEKRVIFKNEKEFLVSLFLLLFILMIVVSIGAQYISIQITKPLRQLANASDNFSKGGRDIIIKDGKYDEVGQLANAFNRMIKSIVKNENLLIEQSKELSLSNSRLELYSEELEGRVKEEVQKNTMQQQTLFNQTRLAQMGEMISMIAHQWRQPLGAIAATSIDLKMKIELEEYDLEKQEGKDDCHTYFKNGLDDIGNLTQNLTTTIDDFRNFYKPNKERKLLNINQLVIKALKIIKTSIITNNIEIIEEYKASKNCWLLEGEVMQVIINILKNAEDNFKLKNIQKAQIFIKTQDTNGGVLLDICDNGGGIDDDIIEKIFDPYYSTKDEKNGTGLGLYMSKTIIEEHHKGSLHVNNMNDGVCFSIELKSKELDV